MRLEAADLYYIPNFRFTDGSTRDKYLLVLSENDNDIVLLSLPTSKGRVPSHLENGQFGCINCDKSLFNCFRFLSGISVTTDPPDFSFPLDTFIYGEWIQNWTVSSLQMDYSVEGVDYDFKGKLRPNIIRDILLCFINSVKVKTKFKKVFKEMLIKY